MSYVQFLEQLNYLFIELVIMWLSIPEICVPLLYTSEWNTMHNLSNKVSPHNPSLLNNLSWIQRFWSTRGNGPWWHMMGSNLKLQKANNLTNLAIPHSVCLRIKSKGKGSVHDHCKPERYSWSSVRTSLTQYLWTGKGIQEGFTFCKSIGYCI